MVTPTDKWVTTGLHFHVGANFSCYQTLGMGGWRVNMRPHKTKLVQ